MNRRTRFLLAAPLMFLRAASFCFGDAVIDPKMHHLRNVPGREWAEFPEVAEAAKLVVTFEVEDAGGKTLRLRQRDVRRVWRLKLNGKDLGKLQEDEADIVSFFAVPAGVVKAGQNELEIVGPSGATAVADDISVGDVRLINKPRAAALAEGTVKVCVGMPCRITVADANGSLVTTGANSDGQLAVRSGVVYTLDGSADIPLPSGKYVIYAGRGFEYSVDRAEVEVKPGQTREVALSIKPVIDRSGLVSVDPHVHTYSYSRHGDCTIAERVITVAGEGLDAVVSAEHNLPTDYAKAARETGADKHFATIMGSEVTTPSLGHFNVFPLADGKIVPFQGKDWPAVFRDVWAAVPEGVVILNHGRDVHGKFRPFDPARHVSFTGESLDGAELKVNAMEVTNSGATMSDPMLLMHDWMGLLNRGQKVAPIGASDSHDVSRYVVGQGRTYVYANDAAGIVKGTRAGRVLVSHGLLVDLTVNGVGRAGDTVKVDGGVKVVCRVQGHAWSKAERVGLYVNGVLVKEEKLPASGGRAEWMLPKFAHDVHLVAIARGAGVTEPFWATAKSYQPTSIEFRPYTIACTGAVYLDADGRDGFTSAYDYAKEIAGRGEMTKELAAYDEAVAAQVASVIRATRPERFEDEVRVLRKSSPAAERGIGRYLEALNTSRK